ncbi:hypothetical protein [Serratia marcescens]|uniref:hypothetical protein n=1 Tax=Serratia marcescens TaxID=615 RepID=UPI0020A535EE|nr:hypothetical protein [Serratia marcescens]
MLDTINSMAFELVKDEYIRKLESGKYSLNSNVHKHSLEVGCDDLRKSIIFSVPIMLGMLFIVIAIGFYSGKLRIIYPLKWKDSV